MAETLEQKVNAPQQEKPEEKKPASTFDSVLSELGDLVNLGIGIAAPVASYALTQNPGVLATSASYVAGTRGRKNSATIRNESLSGAIFGTFAHYTTLPLQYLTKIGKFAYMIPWVFGANAFYMAEDHLIKEKSPKGLYKKFKENYLKINKKAFMLSAPLNILSALFLPQKYMVGAIAVASYLFRRFVTGGKGEEQTDKTPYSVATSSVLGKLYDKTVNKAYNLFGVLGSRMRDFYDSTSKSTSPAPAGAAGRG